MNKIFSKNVKDTKGIKKISSFVNRISIKGLHDIPMAPIIAKYVSIVVSVLFIASLFAAFTQNMPDNSASTTVLTITLCTLVILLGFVLSLLHGEIYWFYPNSKFPLDEREIAQRRRIFELSYQVVAILLFLLLIFLGVLSSLFKKHEVNVNDFANIIFVPATYFLYTLPSIVAAWVKKD